MVGLNVGTTVTEAAEATAARARMAIFMMMEKSLSVKVASVLDELVNRVSE
jgi:hypothetical protein